MTTRLVAALALAATLAACASSSPPAGTAMADETVVIIVADVNAPEARNGCWATFYDERNFGGSSLTLVGPVELKDFDKGTARQLKRDIKSVSVGPTANLFLYEKQFLSARSVGFTPNQREAGLAEKLGFGGRIESLRLTCDRG